MIRSCKYGLLLGLFCMLFQNISAQNIRINEVMPSNYSVLQDEDGDFPDWIEIINTSSASINLSDYYLSDDINDPTQWQFPNIILPSKQFALVFASGKDRSAETSYWHTLISEGISWHYILPNSTIPNWWSIDFDDSEWLIGQSGFGYGDYDDQTIIEPTVSIFMRTTFEIENLNDIQNVCFHIDYDDAFVAFLNGVEIARSGIGTTGDHPDYNTLADIPSEASIYQGIKPDSYFIEDPSSFLMSGQNILAVQVHNSDASSSDLTAIPFLSILKSSEPTSPPPSTIDLPTYHPHTNFKIDADGDTVYVFNSTGQIEDQILIDQFPINFSVGYKPDDYSQLYHFPTPTPGLPNTGSTINFDDKLVPTFSKNGGIYSDAFELSISSEDPAATIYYTVDGSEPTMQSSTYNTQILIDQPTSIKAKIFKSTDSFGQTITQSYYPANDSDLPIFFLSTDPENLWNEETGIYTFGETYETEFPYHGANFWEDWEKPVHMDLFFPSGEPGFSIDGGFKIHGGGSRGYEQKSFNLYSRRIYGDGDIEATIFEDKDIDKFESLVLRNSGNDWFGQRRPIGSLFRDLFMSKLGMNMNIDVAAGRPCQVYLNGEFWGIYNIRERLDEQFIIDNHRYSEEEFDLLEYKYSIINGESDGYREMLSFLENNDIAQNDNYEYLKSQMDISNFIRYQSAEIFFGNWDWPGNNIKFWKSHSLKGKWNWILHDTDFGYALYDTDNFFYHNSLVAATATDGDEWPNPPWSTLILRNLLENEEFKKEFINTFADHLNTTLQPVSTNALIDHYSSQIENDIPKQIEKWGSTYADWLSTIELMHEFSNLRPEILRLYYRDYFSISQNQEVNISISGSNDAEVLVNTVIIDQFPWEGVYFNQIPIELTAIAPSGYQFVRWEGEYSSNEAKIQIPMDTDADVTAVFEHTQPDVNAGIIINEISYHASPDADSEDWVELYNNTTSYVNLSNWIIKDSNEDNYFRFPINTIMKPESYLVVARDLIDFPEIYSEVKNVTGQLGFGFNSAGECVRLFNNIGELQDEVCFSNEYPWPTGADGLGYTLSLKSPDIDNSLGSNWNNSQYLLGSPGSVNDNITNTKVISEQSNTKLLNCFPNPFNDLVYIPIISKGEELRIDVINLNGQLIETVFEGYLSNGTHQLNWNVKENNSGMYLIRLQSKNSIQIKKVLKQ
ncbi:CotH kinase family protein [Sunxiuqinia sp. A32]|uniref:CotH kinase family protein n=1 Tax=Sunxiuqinia sp. A32 TaxID=3461496 RepID=UPI00404677EC